MAYRQKHPYLMQIIYLIQEKLKQIFHSKAIPRKVIRVPFEINGHKLYGWNCPRCERYLYMSKSPSIHYCSDCGQRLDWR